MTKAFTVQMVSLVEGKDERNTNIHGSFTTHAITEFDEFEFNVEQHCFSGFVAIPPEKKGGKSNRATKFSRKGDPQPTNSKSTHLKNPSP